jgi:SAM-dependent methyltransferase
MNAALDVRGLAPDLVVAAEDSPERRLIEYYTEAGPDFGAWSPSFNMHFGFWRRGLRPWRLEDMLEQMNAEVLARLEVRGPARLLDLGCGLGASARAMARRAPQASVTGVTVVPWQVEQARRLTGGPHPRFVRADYRALPWPDRRFDGVYAIESACHAAGPAKADFLREAVRVLRPGGRLVVADAFRKHGRPLHPLLEKCHRTVCRCWRVDAFGEIGAFRQEAARLGLVDITVEDVSWRIVPSVMFVPMVVARFLWRELVVRRTRLSRPRWENALAPLLGMALGAARSAFGYYLVSATRARR